MELRDKTALVLGGARGIGKAIGLALARAGANVIITWHDWPEEAAAMQEELAQLPGNHLAVQVDLREPAEVARLFGCIRSRCGTLHILVNNIERGGMPVVHGHYTQAQWELEIATTLTAKWQVMHHGLPLMKESAGGAVVVLSSIAGLAGRSGPAALLFNDGYAAANRAVSSFTETWAREGAPLVRVNELMLGIFASRHAEGTRGWGLLGEEEKKALRDHILLGRTGAIEEIVKAVFFLIGEATYMTGSIIRMDGGYLLGGDRVPPMPQGVE